MNSSKNSTLLKVVLIALFFALVLSGFSQFTGLGKNRTDELPATTAEVSPQAVGEPEHIPMHPNAQSVTTEPLDERSPSRKSITYNVNSSLGDLVTFYDKTLIQAGWASTSKQDNGTEFLRYYSWNDPQGAKPYSLALGVEITSTGGGLQLVRVWKDPVPDIMNIPLYPGAEQVTTRNELVNVERGFVQRTTSYVVSAKASDVENYYKENMAQYGWWLSNEPNNDSERPGLFFYFFNGSPESFAGGSFAVAVTSTSEDKTTVDIRAWSPELDALHKQVENK